MLGKIWWDKYGLDVTLYEATRHSFGSEIVPAVRNARTAQTLMRHTDRTREEEYFRAMATIGKGGIDGEY